MKPKEKAMEVLRKRMRKSNKQFEKIIQYLEDINVNLKNLVKNIK